MKKIAILLIIALIVLGQNVSAAYKSFDTLYNDYFPLVGIIIFTCALLAVLVYMVGNFLMNEKIKVWAKGEVVELVYSMVIFVIIIGFVHSGNEVMRSFSQEISPLSVNTVCANDNPIFNTFKIPSGEEVDSGYRYLPCHLRVAKNFLASIFYETAGFVKQVGITNSWYIYFSSFSIDFMQTGTTSSFSGSGFSHSILGFLNAKSNALSFLFDNGVKVLTITRFQEVLINFIGLAIFPVMLTAGLILRVFAITRKLGGLLMAIALSLYFIFPIFYIFGDSVYNSIKLEQLSQGKYPPGTPSEKQYVLANLLKPDLTAMPARLNDRGPENFEVNTKGREIGESLFDQLGILTAPKTCKEVVEKEEEKKKNGFSLSELFKNLDLNIFGSHIFGENSVLGTWLNSIYSKGGVWGGQGTPFFKTIIVGIDVLAKAMFFSMFFSFLSIFATIAAIKSLSPMFGGDVEIAGLTHLI